MALRVDSKTWGVVQSWARSLIRYAGILGAVLVMFQGVSWSCLASIVLARPCAWSTGMGSVWLPSDSTFSSRM